MISRRLFEGFAIVMLLSGCGVVSAESVAVDGVLVSPGTYNRLSIKVQYTGTGAGSDTETTDATGTLPFHLDVSFDPALNATVNGLTWDERTPGTVALSDMHFSWSVFVFFSVKIDAAGVRATARTPAPPGAVTGGAFFSADHLLVLNQGVITPSTTAPGQTPPAPVDLSVSPLAASTPNGQGTVAVSAPVMAGGVANYDVTITYPVAFTTALDANTTLTGNGTIRATGRFTHAVPPVVATLPSSSDGANLTLSGSLGSGGGVPADAILYWGLVDGGDLPAAWGHAQAFPGWGLDPFSVQTTLVTNQDYYSRAFAMNGAGGGWAANTEHALRLGARLQLDHGAGVSNVTPLQATLKGRLNVAVPEPVETFFCWGPSDGGTNYGAWSNAVALGPAAPRLLAPDAAVRVLVPTNDLGTAWTGIAFDDKLWRSGNGGVGYDTNPDYGGLIGVDVDGEMRGKRTGCYVRIPFSLTKLGLSQSLTLRVQYDDGFVAYLNGVRIAAANAPVAPTWESRATADHPDADAIRFESFHISAFRSLLKRGPNVLAIHGLNSTPDSSDFLVRCEIVADGVQAVPLATTVPIVADTTYYYRAFASNALARVWAAATDTFRYVSDGDGMPDDWEIAQFGDTNRTDDADADNDGTDNYGEWVAGTIPTNAASALRVLELIPSRAGNRVRWASVVGRTYALERAADVSATEWTPIQTNLAATPPVNQANDTDPAPGHSFYRVRARR